MLCSSSSMVGVILAIFIVGCGQSASVDDNLKNPQDVERSKNSVPEKERKAPADEEQRMRPEVIETNIKLDLPAVPEFVVPPVNADGSHSVPEMRLNGKAYLGQEIRVRGAVLWIYDCATAIRTPEMTKADIKKVLATHPERCNRPHFIVGEFGTRANRGIQVVEYPRRLRKDEKSALGNELVAEVEAAMAALPAFQVGDIVMITGRWSQQSPKGFYNSEGLLTYGSMINLTK